MGWVDYRIGLLGDKIEMNKSFDSLTVKLGVEGQVSEGLFARISLKMRDDPTPNLIADPGWWFGFPPAYQGRQVRPALGERYPEGYGLLAAIGESDPEYAWRLYDDFWQTWTSPEAPAIDVMPFSVDGRGFANPLHRDLLWLDEAYLQFNTGGKLPARWTVGRQFFRYGLGLVANNDRQSLQGVRMQASDLWGSHLGLDLFAGGGSSDYSFRAPAWLGLGGGDSYIAARLQYERPSWTLGVTYLGNGYAKEKAWGADLWWKYWGNREVWAEYAVQEKLLWGDDADDWGLDPKAILVLADLWKTEKWWLRGLYAKASDFYNIYYSTLNPYFEDYAGRPSEHVVWPGAIPVERISRCIPIFPQVRTVGGTLGFKLGSWPIECTFYRFDQVDDLPMTYDTWWSVSTTKQIANGVTLHLLFGELGDGDRRLNFYGSDVDVLVGRLTVSF